MASELFESLRSQIESRSDFTLSLGDGNCVITGFERGRLFLRMARLGNSEIQTMTAEFDLKAAEILHEIFGSFIDRARIAEDERGPLAERSLN